jgi:uncharacterized membrane protein HdeD (DUF308 family)
MYQRNKSDSFDWTSLVLAIIFFIASFLAFTNPIETFSTVGTLFPVLIILYGVVNGFRFFKNRKSSDSPFRLWTEFVIGIVAIIIGLFLLFNPVVNQSVLILIFSIWFISVFLRSMLTLPLIREFNSVMFWIVLVLDILGIIISVMLLLNITVAFVTIGTLIAISLLAAGVVSLIDAFI